MCIPHKVALEKADHKKFSVQEFWGRNFGEARDDESSDDERSDGERSSHEPGAEPDDEPQAKTMRTQMAKSQTKR